MKLEEAQQILHDNGFLMENITEDILSDILWDNLNTDMNTSIQGIRKVCDFLEYDLGKPIERASVKRIAETIVKLYNLGYESERFHPNHQRKIELKDAMKAAALIKSKAKETMTENFMLETFSERADAIIDKYCGSSDGTLEEIENNIEKELGKKPKVSTDHIYQVIWIRTDEFTIIGYYQFDEDTGITYVNPQTVEFPNEEPDYIDDPVYGLNANK